MTDIFISYSRADRPRIEKLAVALQAEGHSVWWDRNLSAGTHFTRETEAKLKEARIVLVAWSKTSIDSMWVADEATIGRDKRNLIPIAIDAVEPPIGFRQIQTMAFDNWNGDRSAHPYVELAHAIKGRLTGEVTPRPAAAKRLSLKRPPRALSLALAGIGVLAIGFALYVAGRGALNESSPQRDAAAAGPLQETGAPAADFADIDPASIAVLPFADRSPEGDQEYFSDGMAEEILNVLMRVDGLRVASRTSSFQFKGQETIGVPEIAKKLKVRHILEGSVRKAGDSVRISAQLIDAATDQHLWSDAFDRTLTVEDVFSIQGEIANTVAAALREKFGTPAIEAVEVKAPTSSLSAYDLNLRSRALFLTRRPENIRKAIELSEQAVASDPHFAKGWEQLGAVYAVAISYGIDERRDYLALAADANRRALSIDDSLSTPYAVAGLALRAEYPTPWELSVENLEKALLRDKRNTDALLWSGMNWIALGFFDKAAARFAECLEIDPDFANCRKNLVVALLASGKSDAAFKEVGPILEAGFLRDADVYIPLFLARGDRTSALFISGQINNWDGFPHADFIEALARPAEVDLKKFAELKAWAAANDVDIFDRSHILLAFHAYEELTLERFGNAYENLWLPVYSEFRKTPSFKNLVRDLGHLAYWRKNGFPPQCRQLAGDDFECG